MNYSRTYKLYFTFIYYLVLYVIFDCYIHVILGIYEVLLSLSALTPPLRPGPRPGPGPVKNENNQRINITFTVRQI